MQFSNEIIILIYLHTHNTSYTTPVAIQGLVGPIEGVAVGMGAAVIVGTEGAGTVASCL